ncbi:NAD(P)/FAD-dependent oxidoreductase [Hymenobacter sp. YC55]|uniref:flavin-containing monooxygenase n=1 Tax=Hymenobacter sp. YC55 TaxID=3034019 RepID=UPI0023F7FD90|nr:NAD(P)/FAD-dependent oxidoreductase [Hymenobacter sp. YC55]MDF7812816.1 NAD(P)/FAD-dependent oxidoreductase [Hymenobacter sp. YC55]
MRNIEVHTLVVGAGQAGLAAAYYLQKQGVNFVVLDERAAIGEVWATRFDALRLFSPAWASGLPGLPWSGSKLRYPSKDEAAAYLRDYAAHFHFPIHLGQRAVSLVPATAAGYMVETAAGATYHAQHVIISTGAYTAPKIPSFAADLPRQVQQIHSSQYHRPSQIAGAGPVAVVGSGNSALQIAADLASTGQPVYVAFDEKTGAMPNNQLMWVLLKSTGLLRLSRSNFLGRFMMNSPEPIVSGDLQRLRSYTNAKFIGRATGATPEGALQAQRKTTPPLEAVVWATGFQPAYNWVKLPIFDATGAPRHQRGLTDAPGIAFLGLPWLDSRGSALMGGAGVDAKFVVQNL